MQVTGFGLRRRLSNAAARRTQEDPTPESSEYGRSSFDDVWDIVVVVCLLALIAVAVFGGAWMFLSRVTAALPVACAELEGCVVARPDANDAVGVDETRTDGPRLTR